jgi:site-specific DNA recombinase
MPDDDATYVQQLVTASQELSKRCKAIAPAQLRHVLTTILKRVVVRESSVELVLSRDSVRTLLIGETRTSAASESAVENPTDLIQLSIETKLKRCGVEVRFIVPPDSLVVSKHQPKLALLKALARAHEWYGWVVDGKVSGATAIAHRAGVTERYVSRVFPFALLAPDIVEAITEGRQPEDLTFEKLWRNLPSSWTEQRKVLGFPCSPHRIP